MGCPTEVEIGADLIFTVGTHDPDSRTLSDTDAAPDYLVFEDETATPILTGTMSKLAGETGFYSEKITCSSANGFENGKTYTIWITARISPVTGGISYAFKAYDQRQVDVAKWKGAVAPDIAEEADIADAVWAALLTAITTSGSIGKFLKDVIPNVTVTTGEVVAASPDTNTSSAFKTNLSSAKDAAYKDALIVFTSGVLNEQVKKISAYNGTTKVITCGAFTDAPADGDTFALINK